MEVTILGNNSALAAHGRHPSAQWMTTANQAILIDCGEGTQFRLSKYKVKTSKLTTILISHLHGDHYFGLAGLLTRFNLLGRKKAIDIFAPAGLRDILEIIFKFGKVVLQYPLKIHHLKEDIYDIILSSQKLQIHSFPIEHRVPTWGFRITRSFNLRKIHQKTIESHQLTHDEIRRLKSGLNISRPNQELLAEALTEPPKPDLCYTYCSDTQYAPGIIPYIRDSDILYHESTFLETHRSKAHETNHSTAKEAALIAKAAQVGKLLLGHYSSRYKDLEPLLLEARSVFPESYLSIEGRTISLGSE